MKKSFFLSVANTLYKKSETDLADDLKDAVTGEDVDDAKVEEILKKLDGEKVTVFKNKETERYNNGIKQGTKETAIKFEKSIKKVLNIETDLEGEELISHIEVEVLPTIKGKGGDGKVDLSKITEEDLKKTPAYILKEKEFKTKLAEKETEKETALKAERDLQKQSGILNTATQKALVMLEAKKPNLPADANKAEIAKQRLLVDEIKGYTYMTDDKGTIIPLDKEGKALENSNGVAMSYDDLVNSIIDKNFEFNMATTRTTTSNKNKAGQGNNGGGSDAKYTGKVPTSKDDYMELLLDENLQPEQKGLLVDEYSEQFSD